MLIINTSVYQLLLLLIIKSENYAVIWSYFKMILCCLYFLKRLAYTLTAYCLWRNRMLRQSATYGTYGTKYRVRQIVHKTTRTDINSKILQAPVVVYLDLRNLKSARNKNNKFLKYKISICLDHTYMYTVLRVPYTCNFIAIDCIM